MDDDHNCISQIMGPGETESDISAFAEVFKAASRLALRCEDRPIGHEDTQITMIGENIRAAVDLGEPVHLDDDLRWNEHHEARMDRIGQNGNDGLHYFVKPTTTEIIGENIRPAVDADGWIKWHGGECPVNQMTLVRVKYANGGQSGFAPGFARDWDWDWGRKIGGTDIVAYKIIETAGYNGEDD